MEERFKLLEKKKPNSYFTLDYARREIISDIPEV